MTQEQYRHPITPPPELVQKWLGEHFGCEVTGEVSLPELHLATRAAQWGSDQELEACFDFVYNKYEKFANQMQAARRPKPPTLAEAAIQELDEAVMRGDCIATTDAMPYVRAALKFLAELENPAIRRALEAIPDD